MSYLAEWQKQQRDLKNHERDSKKNASSLLHNYRRGGHGIIDQERLKALKDADRDGKLNASKLLHSYRGDYDNTEYFQEAKETTIEESSLLNIESARVDDQKATTREEIEPTRNIIPMGNEDKSLNEAISTLHSKKLRRDNSLRKISAKLIKELSLKSFASLSSSLNSKKSERETIRDEEAGSSNDVDYYDCFEDDYGFNKADNGCHNRDKISSVEHSSGTTVSEFSQHQEKPRSLREIMFQSDGLESLPKSHYYINDEKFYDTDENFANHDNDWNKRGGGKRKIVHFAEENDLIDQKYHNSVMANAPLCKDFSTVLDIYHEALECPYYEKNDSKSAYSKADFYRALYSDETSECWEYDESDEEIIRNFFVRNLMYVLSGNAISFVASKLVNLIGKTSTDPRSLEDDIVLAGEITGDHLQAESASAAAFKLGGGASTTSGGSMGTSSLNATTVTTSTGAKATSASASASMSVSTSTSTTAVSVSSSASTSTSVVSSAASSGSLSVASSTASSVASSTASSVATSTVASSMPTASAAASAAASSAGTSASMISTSATSLFSAGTAGSATAGQVAAVTAQ